MHDYPVCWVASECTETLCRRGLGISVSVLPYCFLSGGMGRDASIEDPHPHLTHCWNHILESQAVQPPFWLLRQKAFWILTISLNCSYWREGKRWAGNSFYSVWRCGERPWVANRKLSGAQWVVSVESSAACKPPTGQAQGLLEGAHILNVSAETTLHWVSWFL